MFWSILLHCVDETTAFKFRNTLLNQFSRSNLLVFTEFKFISCFVQEISIWLQVRLLNCARFVFWILTFYLHFEEYLLVFTQNVVIDCFHDSFEWMFLNFILYCISGSHCLGNSSIWVLVLKIILLLYVLILPVLIEQSFCEWFAWIKVAILSSCSLLILEHFFVDVVDDSYFMNIQLLFVLEVLYSSLYRDTVSNFDVVIVKPAS